MFMLNSIQRLWVCRFLLSAVVLISACTKEDTTREYLYNTVLYLPRENGDSVAIADPHVIKVGETWYLYGTGYSSEGLAVWSSNDLENWLFGGLAWKPTPNTWNTVDLWAPHVEQGTDGFYMYYSANSRIGVAFSESPLGPFTELYDHPFIGGGYGGIGDGIYIDRPTNVVLDGEEYAIDAFVLRSSSGKLYMYFSALEPFAVIKVIPMSDYRTLENVPPKTVLGIDLLSWEGVTREGPWVIEHDGVFHLMYSGNVYFSDNYAIGVATADSPLGPFRRRPDNPIFERDAQRKLYGPGHHSVAPGKYGDLLMFYHSRNVPGEKTPRYTRYLPMYFDGSGNIRVSDR